MIKAMSLMIEFHAILYEPHSPGRGTKIVCQSETLCPNAPSLTSNHASL